jgi:acyl-CoA hydrolase
MISKQSGIWKERVVAPEEVLKQIKPGMTIFVGTGLAEPQTLLKHLMNSKEANLRDLTLIQLVSLGDTISLESLRSRKYRLKTFYSGWVSEKACKEGLVDLMPCRYSQIPIFIESKHIPINVTFVQISSPDESGFCSLGVAVDLARQAMEQATIVVGEINPGMPCILGDTFVSVNEFDYLVNSTSDPMYYNRWPVDDVINQVAANIASVIEDGDCILFSVGPLFEALGKQLVNKKNLGVHSPFFTDALMDLVKSGAVTNRYKGNFRHKSLASYALGTKTLLDWLNMNPLVEFQGIEKVFSPVFIAQNSKFISIIHVRKVDLTGRIVLHTNKGNIPAGPVDIIDFLNGSEMSRAGHSVFALPSRNLKGEPNIKLSVESYPNQLNHRESVDMVVTEYGVANIKWRTIREHTQALIEIAHPDDRKKLIEEAKTEKLLYPDQIFLADSAHYYPKYIKENQRFKDKVDVSFRPIKPSDEEEMRRLFYRFSDNAVYYRYFTSLEVMPHSKMQKYVNVDYSNIMSIVGLVGKLDEEHIIAEARYSKYPKSQYADIAFIVDEDYKGLGIATYLYKMLIRIAKEKGLKGFKAGVLSSNKSMMKVFEKSDIPFEAKIEQGVYEITIPF